MAVTLSSQPKPFGNTGWTSWGGVDEIVLEEAYVMSSGSNYWPFDSQPNIDDSFGGSGIALEGDTLVVGVPYEDSNQTTITNGTSASSNNSNEASGAVYIFKRSGSNWVQEAYIKAANNNTGDLFGLDLFGVVVIYIE